MARKRSIKPEFFDDETLANIDLAARLLYIGLWTQMDGQSLILASTRFIKSKVFPHDEFTIAQIDAWLDALVAHRRLIKFHWEGKDLYYCPTLKKHCRIYEDEKKNFNVPEEFLHSLLDSTPLQPTPAQKRADPRGKLTASVGRGRGSMKKGECEGKNENPDELDLFIAECFAIYPARSNTRKLDGHKAIRQQLDAVPEQRQRFKTACQNYAQHIQLQSQRSDWDDSFIKQWATFCGSIAKPNWDEFVTWKPPEIKSAKPKAQQPKPWEPKQITHKPASEVFAEQEAERANLESVNAAVDEEKLKKAAEYFKRMGVKVPIKLGDAS
jgi:hypothetical protein